jgi:hypothetical protein
VVAGWRGAGAVVLLVLVAALCGCRTAPSLPPVNLQAPGWTVRQGQAVWTAKRSEEGVAGELLLATRTDGACFVQFAKPPFTLATARSEAGVWAVELASAQRRLGGRGPAPARIVWFALVEERGGTDQDARPTPWRFRALDGERWQLENPGTGESLEGYFAP